MTVTASASVDDYTCVRFVPPYTAPRLLHYLGREDAEEHARGEGGARLQLTSHPESTFSRLDNVVPCVNAIHFRNYADDIPSGVEYELSPPLSLSLSL